jgi:hypothetical protein
MDLYEALVLEYDFLQKGLFSLVEVAHESGQEVMAERIQVALDRSKERVFRVAIVGEFSTGKSTLINALFGKELLPTALEACTAVVTKIRKVNPGEEPGLLVTFSKSGLRKLPNKELRKALTFEGQSQEDVPLEAQILLPDGTFIDHGIEIVDTPGFNDPEGRGESVTVGYLPNADAIIFLTHAARAFKDSEINFLRDRIAVQDRDRVLFAINACDILEGNNDRSDLRTLGEKLLGKRYGSPTVHQISARDGLTARCNDDKESWTLSGMETFEEHLNNLLVKERGEVQLKRFQNLALGFRTEIQNRLEEVSNDLGIDDEIRHRRSVRLEEGISFLRNQEKKILVKAKQQFGQLRNMVDGVLDQEMKALKGKLSDLGTKQKEEDHVDISLQAQQICEASAKRSWTQAQSLAKTELKLIQRDLADQMSQSLSDEAKKFSDAGRMFMKVGPSSFPFLDFENLVAVHTDRSVEDRHEELMQMEDPVVSGSFMAFGAGVGALVAGLAIAPWAVIPGLIMGAGAPGVVFKGFRGTMKKIYRTTNKKYITQSVNEQTVPATRKIISNYTDPMLSICEDRICADVTKVYSATIAKKSLRLEELKDPVRENIKCEQKKSRVENWLKKVVSIPLRTPKR